MAEQAAFPLEPGAWAEVLTGRLKGYVVRVVREDSEQLGFWWCIWRDTNRPMAVDRERLLNASQLNALGKGQPHA